VSPSSARTTDQRQLAAFEERLAVLTPNPWGLYVMVALNIGVWLMHVGAGLDPFKPSAEDLLRWGGNTAFAVNREHEWWRLLSAMFMHAGLLHLSLNMLGLWDAGVQLCRWFGNLQFLLIYLGSGLAGGALSLHFAAQHSVSVGASGAVFGVLGALLAAGQQNRSQLPRILTRRLLLSQGIFVLYALIEGLRTQGVDNAAHVGGLAAGAAFGVVLTRKIDLQAPKARRRRAVAIATLGWVGAAALLIVASPRNAVDLKRVFAGAERLKEVTPDVDRIERALQADLQAQREGRLSERDMGLAIERRHLPAYRRLAADLQRVVDDLSSARPPGAPAPLQELREHTALMTRLLEIDLQRRLPGADAASIAQQAGEVTAQLQALAKRMDKLDVPASPVSPANPASIGSGR
jgi:rhomboid protease GluP